MLARRHRLEVGFRFRSGQASAAPFDEDQRSRSAAFEIMADRIEVWSPSCG